MITRTSVISAALAVAVSAAVIPTFGGPVTAGPPADTLDPVAPTTTPPPGPTTLPPPDLEDIAAATIPRLVEEITPASSTVTVPVEQHPIAPPPAPDPNQPTLEPVEPPPGVVVPTTGPPPTTEVDDNGASAGPVFFDDHAPEPVPVSTTVDSSRIEIRPTWIPEPVKLNPCGVAPQGEVIELGGVRELDLDGEGPENDRAILYFDGSWKLRVELSSGVESELWISDDHHGDRRPSFRLPAKVDADPDDEIKLETIRTAGGTWYSFFGIDEDGCVFAYVNEHGSFTTAMVHGHETWRAHVDCFPGGLVQQIEATKQTDGSWDVRRYDVVETAPGVATKQFASGYTAAHESLIQPPGWSC